VEPLPFTTDYWILTCARLSALMATTGFAEVEWLDPEATGFYQPIVAARSARPRTARCRGCASSDATGHEFTAKNIASRAAAIYRTYTKAVVNVRLGRKKCGERSTM